MRMTTSEIAGTRVVSVEEDRIDAAVAVPFRERLMELSHDGPRRIVLDLKSVGFLDSSGLGAIVGAKNALGPDRLLDLAIPKPPVEKVFRMTRMDRVFRIYPDANAALLDVRDV